MFEEKPRVLIVESNDDNFHALKSILKKLEIDISRAFTASQAQGLVSDREFALALIDVSLSDLSGFECAELFRRDENAGKIPILFITSSDSDMERAFNEFEAGTVDCVPAPFDGLASIIFSRVKVFLKLYIKEQMLLEQDAVIAEQALQVDIREKQFENELIERMQIEEEITNQTVLIMDSINYASIIQRSLLPDAEVMGGLMRDMFIIWQPRDIVGGDLYWFLPLSDGFMTAVFDCTGHGVPGAFMTVAVSQMLKTIVDGAKELSPAGILAALDRKIKDTFYREKTFEKIHIGLDMGILRVYPADGTLVFAGAKMPLLRIRDGKLDEIPCTKRSVGYNLGFDGSRTVEYNDVKIEYREGDMFYLASDGMADQNGNDDELPFGSDNFKKCILENSTLATEGQKQAILQTLRNYMGNAEQRDDITIMGFMLK